jgi:arabinose-5-phosphate isomerase
MHRGEDLPVVRPSTALRDAIYEMSRKGLGITAVADEADRLLGCISDGDLRRLLEHESDPLRRSAADVMRPTPRTISPTELASAALQQMESFRITSLFVVEDQRLVGIVHLHDLWRLELF